MTLLEKILRSATKFQVSTLGDKEMTQAEVLNFLHTAVQKDVKEWYLAKVIKVEVEGNFIPAKQVIKGVPQLAI